MRRTPFEWMGSYRWRMARSLAENEDVRRVVCDWLRANGVNPRDVPFNAHMSIDDGRLTLLEKVRDENGRDVIAGGEQRVMTRTITVPVVVPPPPLVEEFLVPRCETCGR